MQLVGSYALNPFTDVAGSKVTRVKNFETQTIRDIEGDEIPKEKMSIFELEDRTRIAVRPSGTEPKIKYYLFAQRRPENGKFDSGELAGVKAKVGEEMDRLWVCLEKDAESRLGQRNER